ncbi:MAG: hypothetical protein P8Z79_23265 [Sedimentisphaerales bacterium]|jgi:hypothetical protein
MARFLIEVPHEAEAKACALAVKILLSSGSHYLTHADFGCLDGEHRAWIIMEVDTKEQARAILPPVYRPHAKVVKLNKFSLEEIEELLRHHPD